jgi:formylglycine-generating enzyme required for sulfatase activity
MYPWGNQWDVTRCNAHEAGKGDTTPVSAYPQGASPSGLLDMAGNVWEWARSLWAEYPYPSDAKERARCEDLQARNTLARVLRGGAFNHLGGVRCAYRSRINRNVQYGHIEFRVVMHP